MNSTRQRWAVRAATLVAATLALSLSGGSPSWTDGMKPSPEEPAIGQQTERIPTDPAPGAR